MEENLVLDYCNYQSDQETGYFCFGEQLIPYAFIKALKKRVDLSDFSSGAVLDIYDVLGYDYVASLNTKEYYVVGLCLSIIASESKSGANYKNINVDGKSNTLGVVNEL
ncbi:MAG TPA: hypothetical protein PL133_07510 [Methylophilaceae bacterium]|nr:hypothetical protein [Methylophilaceae bacterium]HQC28728.1 hypothetical protein [Methylotenera sp.]